MANVKMKNTEKLTPNPQKTDEPAFKKFSCVECGHEVYSQSKTPRQLKWSDGHICRLRKTTKDN